MNTYQEFLAAADREEMAEKEAYEEDARLTLDEQIRLGNFAGPLVCAFKKSLIDEFKLHPKIPFDWGKVDSNRPVVVLAPDQIPKIKPEVFGGLYPDDLPNCIQHSSKSNQAAVEVGCSYLFATKFFDGPNFRIAALKACEPEETWPGEGIAFSSGAPADDSAEARAMAACIDPANEILAIKGPPGTGKTDLLARVALALANARNKVGIVTISHAAVNNALDRIVVIRGVSASHPSVQKHQSVDEGKEKCTPGIWTSELNLKKRPLPDIWGTVVAKAGGMYIRANNHTILAFKHGDCDVLLLDEAGQIPAHEAAALSHLAPRMILFGDEDQLPNISKAAHPPGSHGDSSAMEYIHKVLKGKCTIALEVSHRMNSGICGLIKRHFYPDIDLTPGKNADARLLEGSVRFPSLIKDAFPHTSPRLSRSQEEVARVVDWVKRLLQMQVILEDKAPRLMTTDDIAILTPFRAHSAAITKAIQAAGIADADKLRIGTVDKMQGQGAAVVIYSLASSSKDYIANQAEWLFSTNRWNVAISRAHACAIVIGDLKAHFSAVPNALIGIAAQQKIRELMEDDEWVARSAAPAAPSVPSVPSVQMDMDRTAETTKWIEAAAARRAEDERFNAKFQANFIELDQGKIITGEIRSFENGQKYLLLSEGVSYNGRHRIKSSIPYPAVAFSRLLEQVKIFSDSFHKSHATKTKDLPQKHAVLDAYEKGGSGYSVYIDKVNCRNAMVLTYNRAKTGSTLQTITILKSELGSLELFLAKYKTKLK